MAMIMGWIFTGMLVVSVLCSLALGTGNRLAAAIPEGAQAGFTLATRILSRIFAPLLGKIFPSFSKDVQFAGYMSSNFCANFLGLGNAATPMGIQAAKQLSRSTGIASDELCRLIVLNTASIQLIPSTVIAIRTQLGSTSPFDILPAVWFTSICSAGMGLAAAWFLGRLWKYD